MDLVRDILIATERGETTFTGGAHDGEQHIMMLTRVPDEICARYHDRMPLVLPEDAWRDWLDPATKEPKDVLEVARLNEWEVGRIG